jgi:hypothetical protein
MNGIRIRLSTPSVGKTLSVEGPAVVTLPTTETIHERVEKRLDPNCRAGFCSMNSCHYPFCVIDKLP